MAIQSNKGDPKMREILKDLYVEVGQNFRHFLMWRRLLFAGYFAVIAGLFTFLDGTTQMEKATLLVVAALISLIFWLLDIRNRQLIENISKAAARLEVRLEVQNEGPYSIYEDAPKELTHSLILGWLYGLAILGFLVAAGLTIWLGEGCTVNWIAPP